MTPHFTSSETLLLPVVWLFLPALSLCLVLAAMFIERARWPYLLVLTLVGAILALAAAWSAANSEPAGFWSTYWTMWTIPLGWVAVGLSGAIALLKKRLRARR
jgi:hypothetical protein